MLLSTWPPRWEGPLPGLEKPGLRRIGAGQARHAGGLLPGRGQPTETLESSSSVRDRHPLRLVLRGATRGCQALWQRPAEFQREQTDDDGPAGPTFLADEERAPCQHPGLQRADVGFDVRAVLRASLSRVRIEPGSGHVGLQDRTTRPLPGLFWRCRSAVDREAAPSETPRDATRARGALAPRLPRPPPGCGWATRGGGALGMAGGHQGRPGGPVSLQTGPCLTGFGGVLPQDGAPASGVPCRALRRQLPELEPPPLQAGTALRLGQRRAVPAALSRARRCALGLSPPPGADEPHRCAVQALLEEREGRGHRTRGRRMACKAVPRQGLPRLSGQHAHHHWTLAFLPLPLVALGAARVLFPCQGTARHGRANDHRRAALPLHVAPRERLRAGVLPRGDRSQSMGQIGLVTAAYASDRAPRLRLGPAHRGQACARVRPPGAGENQAPVARPQAPHHAREAQVIRPGLQRLEDTKDRTPERGPTGEMLEGAPQGPTQGLHPCRLPRGQGGQGPLAALATVAQRRAQPEGRRRRAVGHARHRHGWRRACSHEKTRAACALTWVQKPYAIRLPLCQAIHSLIKEGGK